MRGAGREVVLANSAVEALQKITQQHFHVVVTDLQMETEKAGLEVLQAAKEKNPDTQVIVVTAFAETKVSVDAMRMGASDLLERNTPGIDFLAMVRAKVNSAVGMEELQRFRKAKSAILGQPEDNGHFPDVFVLMPFTSELKAIYKDHIAKVVSKLKLQIRRADDFFGSGSIMKDIWSAIHAARFVIADCTGRNPNVFYEIGLAHAIGRNTILISQSIDDVPFDLRHLRIIEYKYTPPGMEAFERALTETIKERL